MPEESPDGDLTSLAGEVGFTHGSIEVEARRQYGDKRYHELLAREDRSFATVHEQREAEAVLNRARATLRKALATAVAFVIPIAIAWSVWWWVH